MPNLHHTYEVISAYVTAGAIIHLYCIIERLQENAIYCDTDSVIFNQTSAEPWSTATADKLGDMQSELKISEHIYEFASGVPNNYAYRVITNEGEKTLCKVRCITLNYNILKLLNFEVIRAMILDQGEPVVMVNTQRNMNAECMIIYPSHSRKNRGEVLARGPCYSPTLQGLRSQIQASSKLFGDWPQWVRQVVVLHSLLEKPQSTLYRA